jgi:hypothetical protein
LIAGALQLVRPIRIMLASNSIIAIERIIIQKGSTERTAYWYEVLSFADLVGHWALTLTLYVQLLDYHISKK